ncbi:hypothetical protein [Phytoactinopolyspora mesophila]|uniref:Uncharacterized protein n=1 Tax=Phytoactinopolyspora mesophila TaxID=2650750 RepID=A0A7K3MCK6_9ACTN|nr:hypothetical protein [Phytoactinopolyspora mesophila]NDL60712.1 hypothetical protein [Phytoactinopolyspora mesophila]
MTEQPIPGDDHGTGLSSDSTARQLAALALVRLCIRDEPAQLSVDLLTNDDGRVDLDVVQELVNLAANLAQALADSSGLDAESMLDELVQHVVNDRGHTQD